MSSDDVAVLSSTTKETQHFVFVASRTARNCWLFEAYTYGSQRIVNHYDVFILSFLNNFVIQFDKYATLLTNFWEELSQGTATGLAIVFPFSIVIPHSSIGKMLTRDKQVHNAAFLFFLNECLWSLD
jgi:hypothetical protein